MMKIKDLDELYVEAKRRYDTDPEFAKKARHYTTVLQSNKQPEHIVSKRFILSGYEDAYIGFSGNAELLKIINDLIEKDMKDAADENHADRKIALYKLEKLCSLNDTLKLELYRQIIIKYWGERNND